MSYLTVIEDDEQPAVRVLVGDVMVVFSGGVRLALPLEVAKTLHRELGQALEREQLARLNDPPGSTRDSPEGP